MREVQYKIDGYFASVIYKRNIKIEERRSVKGRNS